MLKIVLLGYGAMGRTIEAVAKEHGDVEIAARCDAYADGCYRNLEDITEDFDVIVDFSRPESLENTIKYCEKHKKPVLIATTGFTKEQDEAIEKLSHEVPVFHTQNMSLGINVMEKVLKMIAPILRDSFDIEIIEAHHNKKVDAPSGTANMLLKAVTDGQSVKTVYGREGYSKREQGEIGMHSIRGGTISGEHTVLFAGNDEIIEIKHTALSKKVFAEGAIKAARFLKDASAGLYQMNDIL